MQVQIPRILGYSKDLKNDKVFILNNLIHYELPKLEAEVFEYIIWFLDYSQQCNSEELEAIRKRVNLLSEAE